MEQIRFAILESTGKISIIPESTPSVQDTGRP